MFKNEKIKKPVGIYKGLYYIILEMVVVWINYYGYFFK